MAGKEGTFIILDVGTTMGEKYLNTDMTRLDFGKESIHHLIRQKLLFTAKRDQIGIILKGYPSDEDDHVDGVHIFRTLDYPSIESINDLNEIQVNEDKSDCDLFDSLDEAISNFIVTYKKLKWQKKIFLITDGEAKCKSDNEKIQRIAEQLNDNDIKVEFVL